MIVSEIQQYLEMLKAAASNMSASSTKEPNRAPVVCLSTSQRCKGTTLGASLQADAAGEEGSRLTAAVMPSKVHPSSMSNCKHYTVLCSLARSVPYQRKVLALECQGSRHNCNALLGAGALELHKREGSCGF